MNENLKKLKSKYKNKAVVIEGRRFASQAEGRRFTELRQLQAEGKISDLVCQPKFELLKAFTDNFGRKHRAITYKADFSYWENGQMVCEDVKGYETRDFKIVYKLFCKLLTIELRILKAKPKAKTKAKTVLKLSEILP